jgi:hypothetical protein
MITLEQAKAHLRVDHDHEDALIYEYIDAATAHAEDFCKRPFSGTDEAGTPITMPAPVRCAVLLIVGDLYANREALVVGTIVADNPMVQRLLWPYRMQSFA